MFVNLKAEMARHSVSIEDLSNLLNIAPATVGRKLKRSNGFDIEQCKKMQKKYFKKLIIDYLFVFEAETE